MTDRDDRRILESVYSETPHGRPSFGLEVLTPALLIGGATYVAFAVATTPDLGHIVGAIALILSLLQRLYVWDGQSRPVHIRERQVYVDDPQPQLRPFVAGQEPNTIRVGRWRFTRNEWIRIGQAIGDRMTRDRVKDFLDNYTETYPDFRDDLIRIGLIDEDKMITERGKNWFADPTSALPG